MTLSIGNLKLRESLRHQSTRDMMTGMYSRRYLEESLLRELLRSARLQEEGSHDGMSVLMIDIDHFKRFNDEHGHNVGDQVLRDAAQVLMSQTRGITWQRALAAKSSPSYSLTLLLGWLSRGPSRCARASNLLRPSPPAPSNG